MTRHILNKGSTHSVIKLMMYLVTLVKGNPLPNYSWWKYTVLVFMVLFHGTWTILQLMLFVPHGERVWGVPYCTHSSLLPVMSSYLPLLDEMCCTTALFIKSCLESDSSIVSTVARYGIYYGRMNCLSFGSKCFFLLLPLWCHLSLDTWSHIMLYLHTAYSLSVVFTWVIVCQRGCSQLFFIVDRRHWYVCWFYMHFLMRINNNNNNKDDESQARGSRGSTGSS